MFQLDFFPKKEFTTLLDLQTLALSDPSVSQLRRLISDEKFFHSPKTNQLIKQQHSDLVDKILGFRTDFVEEMLLAQALDFDPEGTHETLGPSMHQGVQTWVGLDVHTLQTPYCECLKILKLLRLRPYQHVVDLGAAYGRMGVVTGGLFIKSVFTGYEYVKARVDEGNRVYRTLGLQHCELIQQDLFAADFRIPDADVYFLYDFGQVEHIQRMLLQIREVSRRRPVLIVVRGKFTRQIITEGHSWLHASLEGRSEELSIYRGYH